MSEIITVRDIDIITAEINSCKRTIIYSVIEIGRLLVEAKDITGHGGWGKYLEDNHPEISQQTATNWMNLYREYGTGQRSLFDGFVNSKLFGKISVTNHVELLKLPAEEREAFVRANDVENKTVKELQAAIRDRDANLQAAQEQAARAEKAEKDVEDLKKGLEALMDTADQKDDTIANLQAQVKAAQDKQAEAAGKVGELNKKLAKAKENEKAAKAALENAKAHPEIPESLMEEMRQQVAAEAAAKATEDLKKQLAAAQEQAAKAEKERQAAEEKAVAAQKAVQMASPDMVLVRTHLQGVQDQFNKLIDALRNIKKADPETGAKMQANVGAKLIESMKQALEAV